jgi:hypothetical protein
MRIFRAIKQFFSFEPDAVYDSDMCKMLHKWCISSTSDLEILCESRNTRTYLANSDYLYQVNHFAGNKLNIGLLGYIKTCFIKNPLLCCADGKIRVLLPFWYVAGPCGSRLYVLTFHKWEGFLFVSHTYLSIPETCTAHMENLYDRKI